MRNSIIYPNHNMTGAAEAPTVSRAWISRCVRDILRYERSEERLALFLQGGDAEKAELDYINEQIGIVEDAGRTGKSKMTRSLTHHQKVVDINVQMHWSNRELQWTLHGRDLAQHHQSIPKIRQNVGYGRSRLVNPRVGSQHSRWYPYRSTARMMGRIALEFRLLQCYLYGKTITAHQLSESTPDAEGTLGLDIRPTLAFVEDYDRAMGKSLESTIHLRDHLNPYKNKWGYYFKKNGTTHRTLRAATTGFSKHCPALHSEIIDFDVVRTPNPAKVIAKQIEEFNSSDAMVALFTYGRHTRILVKSESEINTKVLMLDPWMKNGVERYYIFRDVYSALSEKKIDLVFVPRLVRDQQRGEGSCSVAALSRAMFLSMKYAMLVRRADEADADSADGKAEASAGEAEASASEVEDFDIMKDLIASFEEPLNDSVALLASAFIH